MGRGLGFVVVILACAVGVFLYMQQTRSVMHSGTAPSSTIDVIGVRNDLTAMANAERRYWVTNSKYATLDELRQNGDTYVPTRPNFTYSAEASENSFRISATYSGTDPKAPRRITVDETMKVTSN
jgi:hypothetical protein